MHSLRRFLIVAFSCYAAFLPAQPTVRDRILRPIDNGSTVRLQGALHPLARIEADQGPVAPTMQMDNMMLVFQRTPEQQAELDQLLVEQQDPASPNYHKWLTPQEFGDRFGVSQRDAQLVSAWLQSQGFTVTEIAPSRTYISFSGIAAQVQAAFHANLHNYFVNGKLHYALAAEPSVPSAFSGLVANITSLNDFHPRPHARVRHLPRLTSSLSGNHFLAPGDVGTIYNLPDYVSSYDANAHIVTVFQSGLDGSGQTIAVLGQAAGDSKTGIAVATAASYLASDNTTFRSLAGIPAGTLSVVSTGSPQYFDPGEFGEASLDTQWSAAIAPNATIYFVYSPDAINQSLPYILSHPNGTTVISSSYGDCEAHWGTSYTSVETSLQQASAQGIAVTGAAGDNLATDCDGTAQNPVATATHGLAVDYPASSQYVTAVGGTQFNGDDAAAASNGVAAMTQYWDGSSDANFTGASAFSYIPEQAWNEVASVNQNVGTGGGVSTLFNKPSWQAGTPADGHRDVPDLSMASSADHDGFLICSQGSCQTGYRKNSDQTFTVIGGTSAASPMFAGVIALANQALINSGKHSLGSGVNQAIYGLGNTSFKWAYYDITQGDNKAVCTVGTTGCSSSPIGYAAAPGYDLATGWGSLDVTAFVNALINSPQPSFNVLVADRSHPMSLANTVTVVSTQGYSGNVTVSCSASASLPSVACTPSNGTVAISAPFTTTVSAHWDPSQSYGLQAGTLNFSASDGTINKSVPVPAQVQYQDFSFPQGNFPITFAGPATQQVSIQLSSVNSFADTVALSCTSDNPQFSCSAPASATLTANQGQMLPVSVTNASTTAVTGNVTLSGASHGITHSIVMAASVVPPDFSMTMANSLLTIASGGTATNTVTVAPGQGFSSDVALTCSVGSSLGATTCSVSPATVTGGNGTATVTVNGARLAMDRHDPHPFWPGKGTLYTLACAVGVVFTNKPRARRARRNLVRAVLGLLALVSLAALLGCGGGNSGGGTPIPTPKTGVITVQGTGGGITHTATFTVTINAT